MCNQDTDVPLMGLCSLNRQFPPVLFLTHFISRDILSSELSAKRVLCTLGRRLFSIWGPCCENSVLPSVVKAGLKTWDPATDGNSYYSLFTLLTDCAFCDTVLSGSRAPPTDATLDVAGGTDWLPFCVDTIHFFKYNTIGNCTTARFGRIDRGLLTCRCSKVSFFCWLSAYFMLQ